MIPPHALEAQRLAEQMRGHGDQPEPMFDVNTSNRPVCDLATLADPCTGCDRPVHRGNTRMCQDGHPRHHGNGMCAGCGGRAQRARARTGIETARPAAQVHSYCRHDEGERCHCARELRRGKAGVRRA